MSEIKNGYDTRLLWGYLIRYHKGDRAKAEKEYKKMIKEKNYERLR